MATVSTYSEMVRENLEHMGTAAEEWRAVPVSRMTETEGPSGKPVSMPVFSFPEGYTHAPTLYPQSFNMDGGNCELCNHPIKRAYHIQHDGNRWLMTVGSECVTHFEGGLNGKQVASRDIAEANRDLLREAEYLKKMLTPLCTRPVTRRSGIGQEYTVHQFYETDALKYVAALAGDGQRYVGRVYNLGYWHESPQKIREIPHSGKYYDGEPVWTDRQIASWLKKHRPALEKIIAEIQEKFVIPPREVWGD